MTPSFKSETRPAYREKGNTYYSDSCQPLVSAWEAGNIKLEAWARNWYPGFKVSQKVVPGVNTIGYWDAHKPQDWGLDWHRNEGIEITFQETGKSIFSIDKESYTVVSDQFTITRPWQPHKIGNPNIGIGKLHWIIFDVGVRHPHQEWIWPSWIILNKKDIDELSKMLRQNERPVWQANSEIRKCFQKIGSLITDDRTAVNESWIAIYINELLLHILSLFREGSFDFNESLMESTRTVQLFINDLNNHFLEPWTLESMANYCKLGTTRFVHYFKQITNSTPMQYLTCIKIEAAAAKFRVDKKAKINQIALEYGFSSSQYFSAVFRKQTGSSPEVYKAENIEKLSH